MVGSGRPQQWDCQVLEQNAGYLAPGSGGSKCGRGWYDSSQLGWCYVVFPVGGLSVHWNTVRHDICSTTKLNPSHMSGLKSLPAADPTPAVSPRSSEYVSFFCFARSGYSSHSVKENTKSVSYFILLVNTKEKFFQCCASRDECRRIGRLHLTQVADAADGRRKMCAHWLAPRDFPLLRSLSHWLFLSLATHGSSSPKVIRTPSKFYFNKQTALGCIWSQESYLEVALSM